MSRTRIVGGKYLKLTKETHYMFSDENISTFSAEINEDGKKDGISIGNANKYEPWKSFPKHDWYHCLFASTVNKKVSISDLGMDIDVQMCLTIITSVIRFEGYDLDSKAEYKFHNWLYILNIYINNRGELVEGDMELITYNTDQLVGSTERNIEKLKGSGKVIFQRTKYPLKSKGKELHDDFFLDHKLIFSNNTERAINFDSKSTESWMFYDRLGFAVREASIFNRRSDVSYVFAGTENAESFLNSINDNSDKLSLAVDSPLMDIAFKNFKGVSLFKDIFGFMSYFTGLAENTTALYEKVKKIRGPIQLTETQCARNNGNDKFIDYGHHLVTEDFAVLGEALQKTNKKLKKDE